MAADSGSVQWMLAVFFRVVADSASVWWLRTAILLIGCWQSFYVVAADSASVWWVLAAHDKDKPKNEPELYIYGVCLVILAGKRTNTVT